MMQILTVYECFTAQGPSFLFQVQHCIAEYNDKSQLYHLRQQQPIRIVAPSDCAKCGEGMRQSGKFFFFFF